MFDLYFLTKRIIYCIHYIFWPRNGQRDLYLDELKAKRKSFAVDIGLGFAFTTVAVAVLTKEIKCFEGP